MTVREGGELSKLVQSCAFNQPTGNHMNADNYHNWNYRMSFNKGYLAFNQAER